MSRSVLCLFHSLLMHMVSWFPKHTANRMMGAADKKRQPSFYVGSYLKWQVTDRKMKKKKNFKKSRQ